MTTEAAVKEHNTQAEVKPRYCVLKLDETQNWLDQGLVSRAKRILGVYLFDANLHVRCCEFTPSYECYFVESQFDNPDLPDRDADWLCVDLMAGDDCAEPVRYFHCWQIDGLPRIKEGDVAQGVIDLDISDEEEAFEYVRQRAV